jgi:hypothetical protein
MAASFAGVVALPLAVFHNQPAYILDASPPRAFIETPGFWAIIDIIVGAFLASVGAELFLQSSFAGRKFILTWLVSLLVGGALWFSASQLTMFLDRPELYSFYSRLFIFIFIFAIASLGVFHCYGLPLIIIRSFRPAWAIKKWRKALWFAGAALAGGALIACVFFNVIDRTGIGFEGSGFIILFTWPFASWGAGLGAAYTRNCLLKPSQV